MILDCFYRIKGGDSLINTPHTHENKFEIVQTLSDGGSFIVNSQSYPITSTSVFLIKPLELHCSVSKDVSSYTRNKLILDKNLLYNIILTLEIDELKDLISGNSRINHCVLSKSTAMHLDNIFSNIYANYNDNIKTKKLSIYSCIFDLFQRCADAQSITSSKTSSPQHINAILEYINNNLDNDKLSLDTISSVFHINKHYLCRLFKRSTNSTLMEYIKLQRITNAKRLIKHTDMTITDIALTCGFSSSSYFSNIFRIMEGISPTQYRIIYQRSK